MESIFQITSRINGLLFCVCKLTEIIKYFYNSKESLTESLLNVPKHAEANSAFILQLIRIVVFVIAEIAFIVSRCFNAWKWLKLWKKYNPENIKMYKFYNYLSDLSTIFAVFAIYPHVSSNFFYNQIPCKSWNIKFN